MAVFVEAEVDPFTEIQQQELRNLSGFRDSGVRRPLRGLEVNDPTYSYMRIITADGTSLPFRDTGGPTGPESNTYANYLLQSVVYQCSEKVQIIPTFGEDYALFFGENPIQAQLTGGLLKSADFEWSAEMWINWANRLRGTRLAERGARLYLYYDGVLLEGLPISYTPSHMADSPHLVPFNMTVIVTSLQALYSGTDDFPRRHQDIDLTLPEAYEQLAELEAETNRQYLLAFAGSQLLQLNRAAYRRALEAQGRDSELGFLAEAQQRGEMPPLGATRIASIDEFLRHSGAAEAARAGSADSWMRQRILPLRTKIMDNLDEYVVRPDFYYSTTRIGDEVGDAEAAAQSGLRDDPVLSGRNPFEEEGRPFVEGGSADPVGDAFGTSEIPGHGEGMVEGELLEPTQSL